jgi:hypothetical protein
MSAAITTDLTSDLTVDKRGRPGLTWLELRRSGLALLAALLALIAAAPCRPQVLAPATPADGPSDPYRVFL